MRSQTRTEHKLIGRWPIDIGTVPKAQTWTDKTMTDQYRCSSNSNWTQTDMKMTDRYRCDPKTETDRTMTDRYRCGPNLNWTQIDMKMADRHRCGPKNWNWQDDDRSIWVRSQKLKWQDEWQIDIGVVPTWTEYKLTGRYLEKMVCEKPKSGFEGQVTYWEGIVKTIAPL